MSSGDKMAGEEKEEEEEDRKIKQRLKTVLFVYLHTGLLPFVRYSNAKQCLLK